MCIAVRSSADPRCVLLYLLMEEASNHSSPLMHPRGILSRRTVVVYDMGESSL